MLHNIARLVASRGGAVPQQSKDDSKRFAAPGPGDRRLIKVPNSTRVNQTSWRANNGRQ